jgi:polyphosphate kinase 2 (PPK2 family)
MCKFWLQIDQKEQLRRFKERERLKALACVIDAIEASL